MDAFGIGAALKGCAEIYFWGARRTGRTSALVESLQDGDRIIFLQKHEAIRVKDLARRMGKEVSCYCFSAAHIAEALAGIGTPQGRLIFDHSWVEAYYRQALERTAEDIDELQRKFGGFGMAHVETQLAAKEINKWL